VMAYCVVLWYVKNSVHSLCTCRKWGLCFEICSSCSLQFSSLYAASEWYTSWGYCSVLYCTVMTIATEWLLLLLLIEVNSVALRLVAWLTVAWLSGRTWVFSRRTFPVLRSTCSWQMTTYVGKPSAMGQPTRPTQPFIPSGSIDE